LIIYFDTSVLVAYYTVEERTNEARDIVAKTELPVVSDLGIAEFNVVVRRKQLDGYLSSDAAESVLDLFDQHLRDIFVRVPIDSGHVEATRRLPLQIDRPLRTLDAIHLAIAFDVNGLLATFDDRLHGAGRSLGLDVIP
jgi:hypothetical protein